MDLNKLVGGLSKSGALNGFLGGVAGGGLTSLVTSKKGKKMGKSAVKMGALAAVGGLAWKAYQSYSSKQPLTSPTPTSTNNNRGFDFTPAKLNEEQFIEVVEENNETGQLLLMRAMITAAYADGHIDDTERSKIFAQVETMDLSVEEKATLFDELRNPQTMETLVSNVPNAQTGVEVYAASATALDLTDSVSQAYLNSLANQLCIPAELRTAIHAELS